MTRLLSAILLTAFLFSGCEKPFEPDISFAPKKMVINSQFSPNNPWMVDLTHSRDVLSSDPFTAVSNALVEIYSGNELVETLTYIESSENRLGHYSGNQVLPEIGQLYELRITSPAYPTVTSSDKIPGASAQIESFDFLHKTTDGDEVFSLNFQDLNPGMDYYHVIVKLQSYAYSNGGGDSTLVLINEKAAKFNLKSNEETHNSDNENILTIQNSEGLLISDENFNLDFKDVELEIWSQNYISQIPGQVIVGFVVELRSVSESYYEFERTVAEQLNNQNNPITTPIEIFNNIEGGHGNFSGFSVVNSSVYWQQ